MLLGATFTALLLCGVSAAAVPPPTDVTVSCQNLKTTVSWKYSSQDPETRFRVTVGGSEGSRFQNDTSELQYDLSHFVWESATRYLDFNCVDVAAVQGGSESERSELKCFSFNYLKTVNLNCLLDFPPAVLSLNEAAASLSFPNPIHFYKELEKQKDAYVKFVVSTSNGTFEGSCSKDQVTCRLDVPLLEGAEPCVTLGGRLCSSRCVRYVTFNTTRRICPEVTEGEMDVYLVFFASALSVFACVIVVASFVICKLKVWKMKPIQRPPSFLDLKKQPLGFVQITPDKYSLVRVSDAIPSDVSEDERHRSKTPDDDEGSSLGFQSSEKLYDDKCLLEDSGQGAETPGHGTDERDSSDSEDEGEVVSPYDRPQHLQDMGDGDMVISYTGT